MMFTGDDVTLYVPCYQAEGTIASCLDGIRNQSVAPKYILLIDDGSEPALTLDGVEIIRHPQNSGLAAARNTALSACKTSLIASLDADVVPQRDWLDNLLAGLNEYNVAGIGGCMTERYGDILGDGWRGVHMAQNWGDEFLLNPRFLFGANTLFRAELVREAGGYDTRLRTNNEDRTLCDALRATGHDLAYTPQARCSHLRRDTYRSILRSYWQWHHARGLVAGHFDSVKGIVDRVESVNFGIFDYRRALDLEHGRPLFAALDACIPWVFCTIDLQLYARRNGQPPLDLLRPTEMPEAARTFIGRLLPTVNQRPAPWHGDYLTEFRRCLVRYGWMEMTNDIVGLAKRIAPQTDTIPLT